MDAPNLTVERVEELRSWLADKILCHTEDHCESCEKASEILALLRAEAARLASPASPDIRPAGYNRPLSGPEVMAEEDERALRSFNRAWPTGNDHIGGLPTYMTWNELGAHIRARLARPAVVSREWLRWQAGEIWSAKTIDDAMDTLSDTLKGFGVEVEGE